MENWDIDGDDGEGEKFYDGHFFPPDLVLKPSEMEILAAPDDISDSAGQSEADSAYHATMGFANANQGYVQSYGMHSNTNGVNYNGSPSMGSHNSGSPDPAPVASKAPARKVQPKKKAQPKATKSTRGGRGGSANSSSRKAPAPTYTPKDNDDDEDADEEEDEEELNRRRVIVAAASRATRQKRKREREELKSRNDQLEKDREVYLTRIAHLQTEVQALRNSGAINLSKENELLRVEIRKHKAFIRSIVDATRAVPQLTMEEQYRLARSGSDSAVGQIVGLAYTSAVDTSFHWSNYNALNLAGSRSPAHFGVQLLPRGCDLLSTKRVNIRLDMSPRPENIESFRKRIWKAWTAPEVYSRAYSGPWAHDAQVSICEIPSGLDEHQTADDAEMRVFHYREEFGLDKETDEEKSARDCTLVVTWRYTKLVTASSFPLNPRTKQRSSSPEMQHQYYPGNPYASSSVSSSTYSNGTTATFGQGHLEHFVDNAASIHDYSNLHPPVEAFGPVSKDDPDACVIIVCTTSVENVVPKQEGVHRINSPFIEGIILRPDHSTGGCIPSFVSSWPLTEDGYSGFTSDNSLVNADFSCGRNTDLFITSLLSNFNNVDPNDAC
mmetsp:Transcript_13792/g.26757  ORF Transcript_13792/g.26757 Transcript_13792/m.26757 type:complete len:610 (+) Transcript_13792:433-2262(+)|eukprot:CAMPEP_0171493204 /NCGR_PEP_ID=MMETSP0958-20121227/4837_1 /TAXON_ID=87120 /ORGANISM="Aurantiochytrium limacinum, Strain ATCCMYA-1381" /LENGTH=609 /DNA_ID=CAMNT_0012026811 /DNA_START=316 /DNA_END=2145 /DNA_ORIENTATION=+